MKKTFVLALAIMMGSSWLAQSTMAQTAAEWLATGKQLKTDKKTKEALEAFRKATDADPNLAEAWYEAGWCYNDVGQYNLALTAFSRTLSASAAWYGYPKLFFEKGYALLKLERYDSALAAFTQTATLKPDYGNVYRNIGHCCYYLDKHQEAITAYTRHFAELKSTQNDYQSWYRKGFCHNALKQYTEALDALAKARQYKPDYASTYLEIGFANTRLKNNDSAIAAFEVAARLDPKSHIPTNGIAEVYRDNYKDYDQAMSWYSKSLALKPDERKAHYGMGYCYNAKRQFAEAASHLEKAIAAEPGYTAAWVELGYAQFKLSQPDKAIGSLNKALELNKANANARYYLTLIYVDKKDRAKAQQQVDELRRQNSKYADELQAKVNAL